MNRAGWLWQIPDCRGLGEVVAQRPLAEHPLAGLECGPGSVSRSAGLDGHDHQVDLVARYEFLGTAEAERDVVLLPRDLGGCGTAGRKRTS